MAWTRQSSPVRATGSPTRMHAFRYGTSLRVAGERDVVRRGVERRRHRDVRPRPIAMRTRDRVTAIGDFKTLTPERARALSAGYDVDYLVTEERLELPVAFASGKLTIYRLR